MNVFNLFTNINTTTTSGFRSYINGKTTLSDLFAERCDEGKSAMPLTENEHGVKVYLREEWVENSDTPDGSTDISLGETVTDCVANIIELLSQHQDDITCFSPYHKSLDAVLSSRGILLHVTFERKVFPNSVKDICIGLRNHQLAHIGQKHYSKLVLIVRWDSLSPEDTRKIIELFNYYIGR